MSSFDDTPAHDMRGDALLPSGFADLLPGEAEAEARGIACVMEAFSRHGYQRVRPPMLEFENALLNGAGSALQNQTFRLMDPNSHRMMALRPDMTTQIARIAQIRLQDAPRPLRLSYSGSCIVVGTPGRETDRQVSQAGIELIGPDSAIADAEVVALGAQALDELGIEDVSFDLSMPALALGIIDKAIPAKDRAALLHALDRKDAGAVAELGGSIADVLLTLLRAAGPADRALEILRGLDLSDAVRPHFERLVEAISALRARRPGIRLTVDPVEFRGWQYHTGLCVTVFAAGSREELGRGGRYLAGKEPACGLTLRPQALLRAAPLPPSRPRCYVPLDISAEALSGLHSQGFATVSALTQDASVAEEAQHLSCTHFWRDGATHAL
ncbi:histidyl-tRNA synthetase [Neokomagataea thailandica NBRC 106555]|uniref:ATP phosphoribosyltransferase regulatory subunit n=2 Tax=Neokomagataea TaxID=1223423 RepID=A0A4Y6V8N6_9PROT|nr:MULTISPECIES: ATP phosphoribosyltransferase regulatory subunit [Neokomagataea]QDH24735.1 ATP phosphoribosyltransferase regulatory subunit [Neokomagataea tanensis]GBR53717.1 histidyl-tRNA synthetase [Neokomagataea thailandica NBRC 106555]